MYLRPGSPMVSMTMPSSMNSTAISAMFWAPVGTSAFLRPARLKKTTTISTAMHVDEDDLVELVPGFAVAERCRAS